ncbi:MAG: sigma-54-dependent Fis family transcriptional regulator [Verrucomicrobia bacterium]|nr:sigma-54-dependent Fis family transcriptional regulator [Verrucomicrobiota bacterium]
MNKPSPSPSVGTVLVVDDIAANRNLLRETLEPVGYEVLLAPDGETALKVAQRARPDVMLLDVMMPGIDGFETCRRLKQAEATRSIPVLFITALSEMKSMVEGFHAGGVDYITKPFQTEEVLIRVKTHLENARLTRLVLEKNQELEAANEQLRREITRREQAEASLEVADEQLSLISQLEAERWGLDALVGRSPPMAKIVEQVRKLQPLTTTSVLITGESGTGKELVARAIHFGGPRAKAPFLPVNCSAIPADLAESLFFGYVKGAFSGANTDKKGYFDSAHGGTLFLDEIGDMPLALQAKLLRVLETGRILPLGAAQEKPLNVRIIAATNADLQGEIAAGKFRQDLYFRLARFVCDVPPLRERREDIALLADHFLKVLAAEMGLPKPGLSTEALAALEGYDYPGSIRELKNLLERAMIECGGGEIRAGHLYFLSSSPPSTAGAPLVDSLAARSTSASAPASALSEEERILAFVRERGRINNTQCRELLGVQIHRAWYLLRKLERAGSLVQDGTRRWAQYRLP